jgi:hypothetical protein
MAMKSFFTKINSWKMNYRMMFIVIALFQCFTYIIFNSDFKTTLGGDSRYYIGMVENLYQHGTFEFNGSKSGRMPGFLPLYLPIRLFFNQSTSLLILIFIQLILYSYAVIYFIKRIAKLFDWKNVSIITVILLLGFSNYISHWGNVFYTESLAVSFTLIGLGLLIDFQNNSNKKLLFVSGIFFAWVLFLRPFMLLIYILVLAYLLYRNRKDFIKVGLLFLLPFIITDSIWITRNYVNEKKIIIAQSSIYASGAPNKSFLKYRELISSFGGDFTEWNPDSEGLWFQPNEYLKEYGFSRPNDNIFPEYIFYDGFTIDSLKKIRSLYWETENENNKEIESVFIAESNKFITGFKKNKPFHYHITSKVRLLKNFIIHPYTYYLAIENNKLHYVQLPLKILIYLLNTILFLLGYLCCVLWIIKLIKKFDFFSIILLTTPVFLMILFPIVFSSIEYRFQVMGVPFLAISIGLIVNTFIKNRYVKLNG